MKNKIITIMLCIVLFSLALNSISAENRILYGRNETNPLQMIPVLLTSSGILRTDMNFSTANIWNTNIGLNTDVNATEFENNGGVLTSLRSFWDSVYCLVTGCTINGDLNVSGTIKSENINATNLNATLYQCIPIAGACDLTIEHSICCNSTGTYQVG